LKQFNLNYPSKQSAISHQQSTAPIQPQHQQQPQQQPNLYQNSNQLQKVNFYGHESQQNQFQSIYLFF
jgi:hypothetical protein